MRIPVTCERDAFRLVFGITGVVAAAVALGVLAGSGYGIALAVGALLGALAWEIGGRDASAGSPLREAAGDARGAREDRHRVLVVANETVGGAELRAELIDLLEHSPEVRVLCPILPSRAHLLVSDIDRELDEARERLGHTLAWASEHGIRATGHVSADTPLEAIADELRAFPTDEVVVSTHPPHRSRWLESGLVDRLRAELDVPVHHVVVDLARGERAAARQEDRHASARG